MFCSNCGNNCPDGTAFCTNCGSPLNTQQTQPTFTAPAQETPVYQQPEQITYEQPAQNDGPVPGDGLGLAALILGIASLALGILPAGIVGLILGKKSLAAAAAVGKTNPKAKAGKILSIIGIIVSSVYIVLLIVLYIIYFALIFGISTGGYYY